MVNNIKIRPQIVVSKCIEHGNCRYDGSQIASPFVKRLDEYLDIITVCPEVEIGLPIPREAMRIIKDKGRYKLVSSRSGIEVTEEMETYTEKFIMNYKSEKIHGFILKGRSPSCGTKDVKVYNKVGKAASMGEKTNGVFGNGIMKCFKGIAIEDVGRLNNYDIRDHFLTRIYTLARYDEVVEQKTINKLIEFHSNNKYLLMAYHQKLQKELGSIVANHNKKDTNQIIEEYGTMLKKALERPLSRGSNINMLMHLFGYFKNELSKEEKTYFIDVLEQYGMKKVPFSVPISIIYVWVIRFEEEYLRKQTIFNLYPKGIMDVMDSGKGRD